MTATLHCIDYTRNRASRALPAKPFLPAMQLADAVMALAAREGLGVVCGRAGVPERVVARWRLGEMSGRVDPDMADQVMTALDLFWWEVWTVDSVREPLFVVTTYNTHAKKSPGGVYRLRRCKDRTIPYGDLGTDYWRLREIEALMVGASESVAA